MAEGPWSQYEDDGDTAVAEGPWTNYGADVPPVPPELPRTQMAEASQSIPLPGYITPFGQDISRTAQARVQSQPSEQALASGAFLNRPTLEAPPLPAGSSPPLLAGDWSRGWLPAEGNPLAEPHPPVQGDWQKGYWPVETDPAWKTFPEEFSKARHETFQSFAPTPEQARRAMAEGVLTPEEIASMESKPVGEFPKAVAGGAQSVVNTVEELTKVENLPFLLAGGLPGKLGEMAMLAFYADMVQHTPEVYDNVMEALSTGDTRKEAQALTDAVIHVAMMSATGLHGTKSAREGVDSFIKNNSPEARKAYYARMRVAKQQADLAPIPQPDAFTKASQPKEPNATIPVRSAETLPLGESPEVSGEVGTRVPESKAPSETQGGEQPPPQPTEASQAEVSLRPAIRSGDTIIEGTAGKSHADIISDATKSGDPIKIMAAISGSSEGRGFVDQNGKFHTRKEAEVLLRKQHGDFEMIKPAEGLHSEDLNTEGHPKTKATGSPDESISVVADPKASPEAQAGAVEKLLNRVQDMAPAEFDKLRASYKTQTGGKGLTSLSYSVGDAIAKSGKFELIDAFKDAYKKATEKAFKLMADTMAKAEKMPNGPEKDAILQPVADISSHPQFFNEVVQRAEWIKSGGVEHGGRFKGETVPGLEKTKAAVRSSGKALEPAESARLMIDPFGVGAARIVAKAAAAPVKNALAKANRTRKAFGTLFRAGGNRKVLAQTFDAAENMANIAGEQMRNRLNIGTKPIEREAALAVIEANGDPAKLVEFERQAVAGGDKDAQRAVRYARNNWQGLQDLATRMKGIMDAQVADENANGISTEYHEAYVPHIYDKDLWMGAGRPFVIGTGGGGGASTGFKKGRTFPTIFDAIEAGYTPESLDVGKLAEHRVKNGQKLINRKQWGEALASIHDPTDGKPLATVMVRKARGPGQPGYEVAPIGYTPREIIPGVRVAIHEGYSSLFDAMTGTSRISGSAVGKMLLETEGALKHGLLLFDTFHASREIQKQLFLTGQLNFGKRGHTLLEYADADLNRAVQANLITPEMAAWVRQNRPVANLLIRNGLNVGRVSEALYTSFVREIPVLGTFNKWVFEKLTRGAMLQSGLIEFERVSKAMPHLTPEQVAQKVARDLNAYFGNLGRQGLFKSATAQDMARLTFLAPQWVESMARTEIQGAVQAAKGLTIDPILHKTIMTGSIGKGVAQGLLAYFIGTQLLNMVTRGHPTWQNPEDKHKLDAWIPDLSGKGGNGFFISPFSVVAELTHDMLRYTKTEGTALKAAAKILVNKLSPPGRALKVLLTGKDFDKTQIDSTWGRAKAAGAALAPTPIPLSPYIKGSQYPGQAQRQITASLGFKTEPAESATQRIADKARDFLTKQGKTKAFNFEPTEDPSYAKLRTILRRGDDAAAVKMLDELQAQHTGKQVLTAMRNHVRHPFTGSKAAERTFLNTLNDKDADLYQKARDEQKAEYDNFLKLWYSRTAAGAPWLNY